MQLWSFCGAVTTPEGIGHELRQSMQPNCSMRKRFMIWQFFGVVREGALRELNQIQEYVILKTQQNESVLVLVKFTSPFYVGRWVDDEHETFSAPVCNALSSVIEGCLDALAPLA